MQRAHWSANPRRHHEQAEGFLPWASNLWCWGDGFGWSMHWCVAHGHCMHVQIFKDLIAQGALHCKIRYLSDGQSGGGGGFVSDGGKSSKERGTTT